MKEKIIKRISRPPTPEEAVIRWRSNVNKRLNDYAERAKSHNTTIWDPFIAQAFVELRDALDDIITEEVLNN